MGPKPKKLTKKQEQELEEKRKEEAKQEKLRELERKRAEEERNRKIEEKNQKIKDDIVAHQEELELCKKEEKDQIYEVEQREELINTYFKSFINHLDWKSYSETEIGYINIRKENEMTGFLHDFKERMEGQFYYNFTFKEKDIKEEMLYFDYASKHFKALNNLYLESKSVKNLEKVSYCEKYMNSIAQLGDEKVTYLTKYFLENFEKLKDMHINPSNYKFLGLQQSVEKTQNNWFDMCIEWNSPSKNFRIGYFCNNENKQREISIMNFRYIPCKLLFLPKQCSINASIIRFVYTNYDETDFVQQEYFPYISINGLFKIDFLKYPPKVYTHGKWETKEMITQVQKIELINHKEGYTQQAKMTVETTLNKELFLNGLGDTIPVFFGTFDEKSNRWNVDTENLVKLETDEISKQNKAIYGDLVDITSYRLLLDKKYLYPYKNWYLRTVVRQSSVLNYDTNKTENKTLYVARLDIETPRANLTFEIGDDTVTLVNNDKINKENELKDIEYLLNTPMTLDEILYNLRYAGILIFPTDEDYNYVNYRAKNKETIERALINIVLASRGFAVKAHELNKEISEDIVLVKLKPNPENDDYFYDDEPKDWYEMGVYPNRLSFGKAKEVKFKDDLLENELIEDFTEDQLQKKIDFLYNPPARSGIGSLIEEDLLLSKYHPIVTEVKNQPGFIHNLRNFLRISGICVFP